MEREPSSKARLADVIATKKIVFSVKSLIGTEAKGSKGRP